MHQAHNIPWHLIEANFKFMLQNKRYTPPRSGLFPKERPQAAKELKHFVKKFAETIQVFSETERKKYPAKFTPMMTGNVFSDELLGKYPEYLAKRNQPIEYWYECFERGSYNGELMDVVNVLLAENEMETLLMLAQHPKIRMDTLHYHCWGHHFGFRRAKEAAIASYLFFNSAEATGMLEKGEYTRDTNYASLVNLLTRSMDYCAQQVPHHKFFLECDALGKEPRDVIVHSDYGRYQQYLKDIFAVMYRYDVLAKECGVDPMWETEIANCYPLSGHVETKWDEDNGTWFLA